MNQWTKSWLQSESAGQDVIVLRRLYVDINDGCLISGVMFSQIMYWHGFTNDGARRLKIYRDGHYWLAKTYSEWWDECRIKERTARTILNDIAARDLIIKSVYKFSGNPTVHIRVNFARFQELVTSRYDAQCHNQLTPDVRTIT